MIEVLRQREGPRLEFKRREVLDDLVKSRVGAVVVAFLNAEGGELYIGVREEAGAAVEIEAIADVDRAKDRLYDHLVDSIEPPVDAEEVRVETVGSPDRPILRVKCTPDLHKRPYAFRSHHGRWFWKRIDARNRIMSREELADEFQRRRRLDGVETQEQQALARLAELRAGAESRGTFWLGLEPYKDMELNVLSDELQHLCVEPSQSGLRSLGWNVVNPHAPVRRPRGAELQAGQPGEYTFLRVLQRGAIAFEMPATRLHWKGPERYIWPFALAELPVSLFRLASKLYFRTQDARSRQQRAVAQLAIFDARGWRLVGGPISRMQWLDAATGLVDATADAFPENELLIDPLHLSLHEIAEHPDGCGFRLVARVYREFNLPEEAVIPEFDRETHRLVLPE